MSTNLSFKKKLVLGFLTCSKSLVPTSAAAVEFPANFGWCVATAAHQIEGGNIHSDHYAWETGLNNRVLSSDLLPNPDLELNSSASSSFEPSEHACPLLSGEDPDPLRKHSVLFDSPQAGRKNLCEYSGESVDHWNRVTQDIALLKELGVREYRMSVEWARIQPRKGEFDSSAIQHYVDEIRQLKAAGIEPQVTLFHFTMPQWLRREGGWESAASAEYFRRFTEVVFTAIGPSVNTWYTFNEPMVHVTAGYMAGVLPPGEVNPFKIPVVLSNMLRAHAAAYHVIHQLAETRGVKVRVGVAHHLRIFDPLTQVVGWNQIDKLIEQKAEQIGASIADYLWNWLFFDAIETGRLWIPFSQLTSALPALGIRLPRFLNFQPIDVENLKGTQDFLGLNYYTRDLIQFDLHQVFSRSSSLFAGFRTLVNPQAIAEENINEMNWEIYPEGFYRILQALDKRGQRYAKVRREIIVSENGIPDRLDAKRESFLKAHLRAMSRAMDEGIPVTGYCHWTLIDNFEWNSGYSPKFGLYAVDLKTQARRLRPSGKWYSMTIRNNGWDDSH